MSVPQSQAPKAIVKEVPLIMRFKAGIQNIHVFTKLTASLASLGNVAWLKLNDHDVRFTIIPENGSQAWAVLQIETIFDDTFTVQSAAPENTVNLEVPLQPLYRALKSAQNAIHATVRLTKKDNIPLLSLTITTSILSSASAASASRYDEEGNAFGDASARGTGYDNPRPGSTANDDENFREENLNIGGMGSDRETIVTQDIPIRVLSPASVEGLHEPMIREPDVHIIFPSLLQLKSISDRFTKLAMSTSRASGTGFRNSSANTPKLELSANMHGCLKLKLKTDAMDINSVWTGLTNPELDPATVEGGEQSIAAHPSTRMKKLGDAEGLTDQGWATVRVEGKDWGRVLGVGRLGGRVIACFCNDNALILYVYLANDHDDTESVITYYVSSFSA